jgi:hypothetical protein
MSQRYLRGFSASERTELWDRWQRVTLRNANTDRVDRLGVRLGRSAMSAQCPLCPPKAALQHRRCHYYKN